MWVAIMQNIESQKKDFRKKIVIKKKEFQHKKELRQRRRKYVN